MSATVSARDTAPCATPSIPIDGAWATAARALWWLLSVSCILIFVTGATISFDHLRLTCEPGACAWSHYFILTSRQAAELRSWGFSLDAFAVAATALEALLASVHVFCGFLIFLGRPRERVALVASLTLIVLGTVLIPNPPGAVAELHPALNLLVAITYIWGNWLFPVLLFTLPDGRLVPSWGWLPALAWGGYTTFAILTFGVLATPEIVQSPEIQRLSNIVGSLILVTGALAGTGGQIYRYRRAASPLVRKQIIWLGVSLLGIAVVMLANLLLEPVPFAIGDKPLAIRLVGVLLTELGFLTLPVAISISVLRYRLWDIAIVLNRALVYGTLTAAVVTLYAVAVSGLSTLLHLRGNALAALVAAGIVAVIFQPLRERLQRAVNRMMYGNRDDPYAVLAQFGRQLGRTPELATLRATIISTIQETLRLPRVMVEVDGAGETSLAPLDPALTTFPLHYQGMPVGRIFVAPREGEIELSPTDRRLLEDLSRQAAVAIHAATVTGELQRARERIVSAREEERRRLRRELHDGVGPTLAAIAAQAEAARDLIPSQPAQSVALLEDIVAQSSAATDDIRRMAYDLRPPTLDELGLTGAIEVHARRLYEQHPLRIAVEADALPPLPAAVEVAAFRITYEALLNAVRHASASRCDVTITVFPGELALEVRDDGRGLPAPFISGVGVASMRERALELGGSFAITSGSGTTVAARLPL